MLRAFLTSWRRRLTLASRTACFLVIAIPSWAKHGWRIPVQKLFEASTKRVGWAGAALLASMIACHVVFH